jgi:hypothetical protein
MHQADFPIATMCRLAGRLSQRLLRLDEAAAVAWRSQTDAAHAASRGIYGAPRIHVDLAAISPLSSSLMARSLGLGDRPIGERAALHGPGERRPSIGAVGALPSRLASLRQGGMRLRPDYSSRCQLFSDRMSCHDATANRSLNGAILAPVFARRWCEVLVSRFFELTIDRLASGTSCFEGEGAPNRRGVCIKLTHALSFV